MPSRLPSMTKKISVANLRPPDAEPSNYQAVDSDLQDVFWPAAWDREWQEFMEMTSPDLSSGLGAISFLVRLCPQSFEIRLGRRHPTDWGIGLEVDTIRCPKLLPNPSVR